jgi:hypothetical protein
MIIFVRTKLAFPNRERVSIFADFALYPHSAFRERIVGMSRTTATFSISLPPEMGVVLERVLKDEHRTRSELVREASSLTNEKPACRLLTVVSASGTLQCNKIRVSPLGLTVRRTISFLRSFGCIGNE